MLYNSKKIFLLLATLLILSHRCSSMELVKTGVQQIFNQETFKIAGAGFIAVMGYYTINSVIIGLIMRNNNLRNDLGLNDEIKNQLSEKPCALQAISIGSGAALAARLGPKAWHQLSLNSFLVPSLLIGAGVGISSFQTAFYNKDKTSGLNEHSLTQELLTTKSCMDTLKIIIPLSIVYYRYIHKN